MATFLIPNSNHAATVENFTSVINRYGAGLAQACRYLVVMSRPRYLYNNNPIFTAIQKDLSYLCEQAEMPGKTLSIQDARYYGPNFKYPIQTEYSDITMTFIVRDQMYEKEYFDNWLMSINPNSTYDFSYKSDYVSQIDIIQYSAGADAENKSIPTYKVTLVDAFPTAIAPMGLVWGEEGFHRVAVTFAYTEIKRKDDIARKMYSLVETGSGGASKIVTGSVLGGSQAFVPTTVPREGKGDRNN